MRKIFRFNTLPITLYFIIVVEVQKVTQPFKNQEPYRIVLTSMHIQSFL